MHLVPRTMLLGLTADGADEQPRTEMSAGDRTYWLGHCEGFWVQDESGHRLGVVERVEADAEHARPDVVAVAGGTFRPRTVCVPADDVVDILPGRGRLVVTRPRTGDGRPLTRRYRSRSPQWRAVN